MDAWQDPDGGEQQQYGHLVPPSPDPDVVLAPPNPESRFPSHPVSRPVTMLEIIDLVTVLDGSFLPRSDSQQSSRTPPRKHNEPEASSRDGQPINVDAPDQVVLPRDVDMPSGEFEVGADGKKSQFSTCSRTAFRRTSFS